MVVVTFSYSSGLLVGATSEAFSGILSISLFSLFSALASNLLAWMTIRAQVNIEYAGEIRRSRGYREKIQVIQMIQMIQKIRKKQDNPEHEAGDVSISGNQWEQYSSIASERRQSAGMMAYVWRMADCRPFPMSFIHLLYLSPVDESRSVDYTVKCLRCVQ